MDSEQRDKLVSDVKKLQKLTRNLEKSSSRIGKDNDTVSWRKTLNNDVQTGVDLVQSLQSTTARIRAESINNQDDKLMQQSIPHMQKFNLLKQRIDEKLSQHFAINDNPFGNDNGNAYDDNNKPPSQPLQSLQQDQVQQQEQIEQIGLIGMSADLDHIEEQNRAVKQIAEDVTELKEAFTDLNVLVEDQGEMITHVEQNTEKAKDQVAAGTVHLNTAEKHQKSYRKKQCIVLACCVVLIVLIFALLGGFGVFGGKN